MPDCSRVRLGNRAANGFSKNLLNRQLMTAIGPASMSVCGSVVMWEKVLDGLCLGQDIGAAWLVVGKNGD